jgi:hypothetical protein
MSKAFRRIALVLAAVLVLSLASFAANEMGVQGAVEFTLKYDGFTGDIIGNTYLKFAGVLKNAPAGLEIVFGDSSANGFWKSIDFWSSYPTSASYVWSPYFVRMNITGAYYRGGPRVTTRLGDFQYPVPNYLAGNYHKMAGMGIMITDYPVYQDKVTVTPFFAWPKYGAGHTLSGAGITKYFWNMGAVVKMNNLIPDLSVQAYVLNHQEKEGVHVRYGAGLTQKQSFAGVNTTRGADQLILFTPGVSTNTNPWGKEVLVGPDGKILKKAANVDSVVPAGHYVISGHGSMNAWINNNLNVGDTVQVMFGSPQTLMAESTAGVEASYKLFGVNMAGKFLFRTTYDGRDLANIKKDNQMAITANADYTFVFTNDFKVKVSGGFRSIDQDFAPFARQTDVRYNPIEAQRGQLGGNAALNFTLPAKTALDITADYFNKKPAADTTLDKMSGTVTLTNSALFDVTAKASVSGSRQVDESPAEVKVTDSITTSGSLSRNFRLPTRDQLAVTYSISTTNLLVDDFSKVTLTNKLVASTNLTVPVISKLYIEGTVELKTAAGSTTPTYILLLKHTTNNNLNLEAKFTKAGIQKLNWYAQAFYSVSLN